MLYFELVEEEVDGVHHFGWDLVEGNGVRTAAVSPLTRTAISEKHKVNTFS